MYTDIRVSFTTPHVKDFCYIVAEANRKGQPLVSFIDINLETNLVTIKGIAAHVAKTLGYLEGEGAVAEVIG